MRIPRKVRWTLALVVGLGMASMAVVGLASPPAASVAEPPAIAAVRSYLDTWSPERDPLVRLASGADVKASNLYGVIVEGTRYYYRVVHAQSFDPKSRGEHGRFVTVATLDVGTPWETEIYRWMDGPEDSTAR